MDDFAPSEHGFAAPSTVAALRRQMALLTGPDTPAAFGPTGAHYTDPDYFAHECRTLLADGWHCVARADELPEPGDFMVTRVQEEPIVLVRDGDVIRALSNLCRHRGMPLAQGKGRARLLVCPYHAWSYRTDGRLQRAPRMDNPGFDPKGCRLPSFACEVRFGFVYVSLSDAPPDLDADLAGLDAQLAPYAPERYRIVHSAEEVWHTNWKSLIENFMEGYHLSVVHPQTLHGYTPTELSRKGPSGAGFTSYFANYPQDIPSRGTGAPGLSAEQHHQSFLFAAFPGQVASIAPSLLVSLSLMPRAVDRTEVRWTMSVYKDALDEDTIAQRIALWTEVNREDREKLEAMQAALRSRHATGGPLAGEDYEGTVRDFLAWIARRDLSYGGTETRAG